MAVPSIVSTVTDATSERSPLLVSVKVKLVVPESPSACDTSSIIIPPSSSWMVPTPCPSNIVLWKGEDRLTVNVSSSSITSSPFTVTVTVVEAELTEKFAVPLLDV